MADKTVVSLDQVVDELEMISEEATINYNRETGEFVYYHPDFSMDDIDPEDFEGEEYVSLPRQRDLNEYDLMTEFSQTVNDLHTREVLEVALAGKGAFRRFKDVVSRAGIAEIWYAYRKDSFRKIAREWCEENRIAYK